MVSRHDMRQRANERDSMSDKDNGEKNTAYFSLGIKALGLLAGAGAVITSIKTLRCALDDMDVPEEMYMACFGSVGVGATLAVLAALL